MPRIKTPWHARRRRHMRLRSNLKGTLERPRLAVFRSARHTYAQVIDDTQGHTLAAASTLDATIRTDDNTKLITAREVGKLLAERAKVAGVNKVVFDRGGYRYHGRVKELADGAREEGLTF